LTDEGHKEMIFICFFCGILVSEKAQFI